MDPQTIEVEHLNMEIIGSSSVYFSPSILLERSHSLPCTSSISSRMWEHSIAVFPAPLMRAQSLPTVSFTASSKKNKSSGGQKIGESKVSTLLDDYAATDSLSAPSNSLCQILPKESSPPCKTHSFLYFDTHLISNTYRARGARCAKRVLSSKSCLSPVTFHDRLRAREIAETIKQHATPSIDFQSSINCESDKADECFALSVVGLSGVWAKSYAKEIIGLTSEAFPFSYNPKPGQGFFGPGNRLDLFGESSGLLLLSRNPLRDCEFELFQSLVQEGTSRAKGILSAIVMLPGEHEVLVVVTHLQGMDSTEAVEVRSHNIQQIGSLIRRRQQEMKAGPSSHVVVLGNMNIEADSQEYFQSFKSISRLDLYSKEKESSTKVAENENPDVYLYDAWSSSLAFKKVHPSTGVPYTERSLTYDSLKNPLVKIFTPGEQSRSRVDFCWISQSPGWTLKNRRVHYDWKMKQELKVGGSMVVGIPFSNHYPISVDLEFI